MWSAEPSWGPGAHQPLHSSACAPWPHRRWKLQVLDLRRNAHQDFWTVWSGIKARVCSLLEPEPAQPMQKRSRVEGSQGGLKPARAPVEVLVDLCLKEDPLDETLCYLLKKAKQRRSLLRLRCQKLRLFTIPVQSIRRILKLVQLDSIQDLEVNCTWKLATLGRFLPHLGRMGRTSEGQGCRPVAGTPRPGHLGALVSLAPKGDRQIPCSYKRLTPPGCCHHPPSQPPCTATSHLSLKTV